MIKVVTLNQNGKVELTKEQLEEMLEEARTEGRNEVYAFYGKPFITTTGNGKNNDWCNGPITYCDNAVHTTLLNDTQPNK